MCIKRSALLITTFLALCLVSLPMVGCRGQLEAQPAEENAFHFNLPRLQVTFDEQGEPTILGVRLSSVESLVQVDLSRLRLSPELVQQLVSWNIQHVELAVAADGVFIFVNNKPLPYLAWDAQTLAHVGERADKLEVLPPIAARYVPLQKVLPLVRVVGMGVVLKFPVAPEQEAIPFEPHPDGMPVAPPAEPTEKPVTLFIPLEYDQAGEPSFEGVKVNELGALTGQPMAIGKLDQATMTTINKAEVESLLVKMEAKGLVPYVDGKQMPYVSWADEYLLNLIDLYEATNPGLPPFLLDLARRAVPGVKEADIQISAEFAARSELTPIPPTPTPEPTAAAEEAAFAEMRHQMVERTIRARGVSDPEVLQAVEAVPRHRFVLPRYLGQAYADHPLPIGYGQTISQPYIVALMTELLRLKPGERVLEIGTGSGYQAAVLAELVDEVYSIEIIPELAESGARRLMELGYDNVRVRQGDGYYGWEEYAPFDAIIVTCAPDHVPQPLVNQLAEGGRLVVPIGPPGGYQTLWQYVREADGLKAYNLGGVRFVPLLREVPGTNDQ